MNPQIIPFLNRLSDALFVFRPVDGPSARRA